VATDVTTGTRRVLARGDAAAAIQASTAVPVLFTPVHIDAERLVDGALVEPVPVAAARSLGADFVIAVDVAYRPYEEAASGLTAFAFQAMHILVNSLAAQQLRDADYSLRLDLHHQLMRCGSHSLIEVGRAAVRDTWPALVVNLRAAAARSAANARADLRIPGPLR
jgi:NTE family protein